MQRGKRRVRGWYFGDGWTIAEAIDRSGLTREQWESMSWWDRSFKIAKHRAQSTMQAWETYISTPKDQR